MPKPSSPKSLARFRWDGPFFPAALREVPPAVRYGRLIDVLEPAAEVLDQAAADVDQDVCICVS